MGLNNIPDMCNGLLLFTMLAATLHDAIAEEILSNYQSIVEEMTSQFQDHSIGGGISLEMVNNLPNAVSPVCRVNNWTSTVA